MARMSDGARSRRAFLAGVMGAVGAAAGASLAGVQRVLAAGDDGKVIHVGDALEDVSQLTRLANHTNNATVLTVISHTAGTAIYGSSTHGNGIRAQSLGQDAVRGTTSSTVGAGVHGVNNDGDGVWGSGAGRGGRFWGTRAQVRLNPSTAGTHPTSGLKGDLFVDRQGRLWFCRGRTAWTRLA